MKQATQILRQEHDAILKMLDVTDRVAEQLDHGTTMDSRILEGLLEFFTLFADKCHHGKEEDLLFPLLEEKGIPRDGGPIGVMLHEHDLGRAFVRQMRDQCKTYVGGDAAAGPRWAEAARGYTALLRQHIQKENEILFVMAENAFSDEEQVRLAEEFERVETEKMGEGTHERLHAMMERLIEDMQAA